MPPVVRCLAAGLLAALVANAQSLRIPPSQTDRKTPGTFYIVIKSPAGKAPVGLQWELAIPPALLVASEDIAAGKAGEAARKSLACSSKAPRAAGALYICILAGGQDAIGNGPIAAVRYRARAEVQGAPIRVAVEKIVGVSVDLKRINIEDAVGIFRIR